MGNRKHELPTVVAFLVLLLSSNIASAKCAQWAAKVASVQGHVEAKRADTTNWQTLKLNDSLCPGDQIRVGANSRAAIVLANETLLRLDQNSAIKLSKIKPKQHSIIDFLKGIGHFISRVPRSLKVETPTMNAAIEGTEFVVAVFNNESRVTVFEGTVLASNSKGKLRLSSGDSAVATINTAPQKRLLAKPRDAVQWALYYPPVLDPSLKPSDPVYKAAALLNTGRVNAAARILGKLSDNGQSLALQSIIAIMQNNKSQALQLAQKATSLAPKSAASHIALSYAWQANLKLDEALESANESTRKEPANAIAWARLAELQLSVGELDDALDAAQTASRLNNKLSRTQTVLGYAHLVQIDIDDAMQAFHKAINLDQTDPLPRLGLGLAKIRNNDLAEGRREIEIAASLDPNNAIIRSYLGKAYFEEKRSPLDTEQFDMAKALDPKDPTPWFYDAIAKQTENRPVEALESLQKSIELNDNRAVYRSSLQLDQDQAARSASQARIYSNLGFEQLALQQAYSSLNHDPTNHSAHRLLSDAYSAMPRYEIARVSELLQAQLLQPVGNIALQPHLAESTLATANNLGPSQLSFNEFNPLFVSDGLALQANGLSGTNSTSAGDAVISGILSNLAFSLGYYEYQTDGFRDNNNLKEDVSNAFIQYDITPSFSIQAEKRHHKKEHGDISMNFDPTDFSTTDRRKVHLDTERIGARYQTTVNSNLLFSYIKGDNDAQLQLLGAPPTIDTTNRLKGKQYELQYIHQSSWLNVTMGIGDSEVLEDRIQEYDWSGIFGIKCPQPFINVPCEEKSNFKGEHQSAYIYANTNLLNNLTWTLGLSHEDLKYRTLSKNEVYPKTGLQFNISKNVQLRIAYLKTIKKPLLVQQTIEPTQVTGFNQLFDDTTGTIVKQRGIGISAKMTSNIYTGLEFTRRDLDIPAFYTESVEFADRQDDHYRIYANWLASTNWSLSTEYQQLEIENKAGLGPRNLQTQKLPLKLSYRHPSGFYNELEIIRVKQQVELPTTSSFAQTEENFSLVNLALGYRLFKRQGIVSLEVNNLFNEKFLYQDLNFTRSQPINPSYIPERTVTGRLTLSF